MRKLMLAAAIFSLLQAADLKNEQKLQRAVDLMEIKGDLAGAITLLEETARSADRSVAARALLYLAQCQERQGREHARATYQRLASDFKDQRAIAAQAQQWLAALNGKRQPAGISVTQISTDVDDEITITPDGRWMALVDWTNGDLAVRDMASGQQKRLMLKTSSWAESSDFVERPVLTPDARQIAYLWFNAKTSRYELRLSRNEIGAKPKVLVEDRGFDYFLIAGWSRDGKSLLAGLWRADGTSEIGWVSLADGSLKRLKSLEWRNPLGIALSPDGRYIAYDALKRQDSTDREIHVLSSEGASEYALAKGPGTDAEPAWTPEGANVVFKSDRMGSLGLWAQAVRDGRPEGNARLLKADIGQVLARGFTTSGAFHYLHQRGGEDIFSANMDGSGKLKGEPVLLVKSYLGFNRGPVWSPDGRYIAYHSRRGTGRFGPGALTLIVRSVESGEERAFPWNHTVAHPPVWFPDGQHLLLASSDNRNRVSYHRLALSTGKAEIVSAASHTGNPRGSLSPDGRIYYAAIYDHETELGRIAALDLITGEWKELHAFARKGHPVNAEISPDGGTLAISLSLPAGNTFESRLLTMDTAGKETRTLFAGTGSFRPNSLAWSRDGRFVYAARKDELWRFPASGADAESTGLKAKGLRHISISPDGSRIAFVAGPQTQHELWRMDNLLSVLKSNP